MNRYDSRRIGYLERALAERYLDDEYDLGAPVISQRTGEDGLVELVVQIADDLELPYESAREIADALMRAVWMPVAVLGGQEDTRADSGRPRLRALSLDPRATT